MSVKKKGRTIFMFNLEHILYIVISSIVTAFLLFLSYKYVKEQKTKDLLIKISAVVTVIIHYSNLLVEYFQGGGDAYVENNHILPVYPCNILMWMLLILAFLENKKSPVYRFLAEFCFIVGTVCGIIGIVLNFNFDNTPTLADYSILSAIPLCFSAVYISTLVNTLSLAFTTP